MNNNMFYFLYSKQNPERMLDPYYAKKQIVITEDSGEWNALIEKNEELIELIGDFKELREHGAEWDTPAVKQIVERVILILDRTKHINYTAFSQFFMVYNSTFSEYEKYSFETKRTFIFEMLDHFSKERHSMYLSHGYSNIVLQVMADNYSHKRNSKSTIDKILIMLDGCLLSRICRESQFDQDNYYFLPDKGDSALFDAFLKYYNLKMTSRDMEQNKYPDIVFKYKGQVYICELKTTKGSGGGQDKQMVELINFIKYSEESEKFHYLAFLDGSYPNMLLNDKNINGINKVSRQYNDLVNALKNNPQNYFVNTAGFAKFIEDIISY